ncbi:hypothetical protein QF030_007192 [Streptomyces rishiriensis]|uniref:Uncharacterized protein n=1 Tax=Streptomyces rishiriensis TaxID=68264 RepID=A0ABU0P0Z9_STRRH|nr:hypothetical protein [Streptomyces rishiriensis]
MRTARRLPTDPDAQDETVGSVGLCTAARRPTPGGQDK